MTTSAIESSLLINELQLGEKLNVCVQESRRSDFSLLLAMLVEDVREHSQFYLPESVDDPKKVTESQLRHELQVPPPAPLALHDLNQIEDYNQVNLIESNNLPHLKLTDAIQPKPLVFRDDAKYIDKDVLSNTSLYCQKKRQGKQDALLSTQLKFQANLWLNAVEQQLVKAPLFSQTA